MLGTGGTITVWPRYGHGMGTIWAPPSSETVLIVAYERVSEPKRNLCMVRDQGKVLFVA